jgi:hypothetical protein
MMDIIGVERGRMELLKGELAILHHFLNFQPFVSIEVSVLPQVRLRLTRAAGHLHGGHVC